MKDLNSPELIMPFMSLSQPSSKRAASDDSAALTQPTYTTYEEGAILTLRAHDLGNRLLAVRILRLYRPFSHSCVMKVEILHGLFDSDKIPHRVVLKLFDRRFARKLRNEHKVDPWDPSIEEAYVDFVNSGAASEFMDMRQGTEYMEEPESGWTSAESETYLQGWCSDMFTTEVETYQHLNSLQGDQIPKLFSSVVLLDRLNTENAASDPDSVSPMLGVSGLLMEHIVGPTLVRMPDFISPKYWQPIVDDALRNVHTFSDHEVVNEGVCVANIIASPINTQHRRHRVVTLDLAQCIIRQTDQSDTDWGRVKAIEDEEGTVGRTMSAILEKVGFELCYVPSKRFDQFGTQD